MPAVALHRVHVGSRQQSNHSITVLVPPKSSRYLVRSRIAYLSYIRGLKGHNRIIINRFLAREYSNSSRGSGTRQANSEPKVSLKFPADLVALAISGLGGSEISAGRVSKDGNGVEISVPTLLHRRPLNSTTPVHSVQEARREGYQRERRIKGSKCCGSSPAIRLSAAVLPARTSLGQSFSI